MHTQTEQPAPSLAEQYSVMASEDFAPRRVDIALRALDLLIAGTRPHRPLAPPGTARARHLLTSGTPGSLPRRAGGEGRPRLHDVQAAHAEGREPKARLGNVYGEELSRRTEQEVTMVGKAARLTHIDEVPQLYNVLRGDMSMVGPRPVRPAFFYRLVEEVPQYWQRLVVRPGRHRLRADQDHARGLLGGQADPRPRVHRGPLDPALPPGARGDDGPDHPAHAQRPEPLAGHR